MKLASTLLLLIIFSFKLLAFPQQQPPLTVVMSDGLPPYSFIDSNQQPAGYLVDYWRLWAEKTGQQVSFSVMPWSETLAAIAKNEAHIHIGLFKNEERLSAMEFVAPIYQTNSSVFINNRHQKRYSTLKDFQGKRIAVIADSFYDSFLLQQQAGIIIERANNTNELIELLTSEQVDAIIGEEQSVWTRINTLQRQELFSVLPQLRYNDTFYAAIPNGNPQLIQLIEAGQKKISDSELAQLSTKWMHNLNINQQQLSNQKEDILSSYERRWLADNPTIELAVDANWKPVSYLEQGELKGFHAQLLKRLNEKLSTNFKPRVYQSWNRAFNDIKTAAIDGVFGLSWTEERTNYVNFSPVYLYAPVDIVVPMFENTINTLTDLNYKTVATFKNTAINDELRRVAPEAELYYISTVEQGFKAMKEQRVDAVLISFASWRPLERNSLKIANSIFLDSGELSIGTIRNKPVLANIIRKGLNSISLDEMSELQNTWLKNDRSHKLFTGPELDFIKNNPKLVVGIESWSPVVFQDSNDEIGGVVADLLSEISKITNISFEPVFDNWPQLVENFKKQKIDILPATVQTKERQDWGFFSEGYLQMKPMIYVDKNESSITGFQSLEGKRLAILKDSFNKGFLSTKFPKITLIEFETTDEQINSLQSGDSDALLGMDLAIKHRLSYRPQDNLRAIPQYHINRQSLRILTEKSNELLASIIRKSLYEIPLKTKNDILKRWIGSPIVQNRLSAGLRPPQPPYVFKNATYQGIYTDLIKLVFSFNNIEIVNSRYLPLTSLKSGLTQYPDLDLVVDKFELFDGETTEYKGQVLSEPLIDYQNVAVTRQSDNLFINDLRDLLNKRVAAFSNASTILSPEYQALFSVKNRSESYQEMTNLEQVNAFIAHQVDVLIIDKRIFHWLIRQAGIKDDSQYKFDYVFKKHTPIRVAFKDSRLRDIFDANLNKIKANGDYQYVINDYLSGRIIAKHQYTTFTASLIAKALFEKDHAQLDILAQLLKQPFINSIKIKNTIENELVDINPYSPHLPINKRSYYQLNNSPNLVGSISISFDNALLDQAIHQNELIPPLNHFSSLEAFHHIKQVYEKFNFLSSEALFTEEERNYIANHPVVKYSDITWAPITIANREGLSGLSADYLELLSQKTGLEFRFTPVADWNTLHQRLNNGDIDIIPSVNRQYGSHFLSEKFTDYNYAIVTHQNGNFMADLTYLHDKKVAVPRTYSSHTLIKEQHPRINLTTTDTIEQALTLVREGKVDAFVGHLAVSVFQVKNNFPDLKIAGVTDDKYEHFVLINKHKATLLSILNKAIASVTFEQRQAIRDRWISVDVEDNVDYTLLYRAVAIFSIIVLIGLYFVQVLLKANRRVAQANDRLNITVDELVETQSELKGTINHLEEAQEQLIAAEKMASLGSLVAGVAHEINTPVGIGLTGISHFQMMTDELTEKYNQQTMAKNDFERYLRDASQAATLIHNNLEKTAELVRSFKQISVDQSSDEVRSFNLSSYIDDTLISVASVLKHTEIEIVKDYDTNIVIKSHPGAISQIISNLVLNASIHAFSPNEKGKMTIAVSHQAELITLSVADNGKGIPVEFQSKIFEPFFTTNRENGGSGLGLNIIYNIITNQLDGSIECISELGRGTQFVIKFKAKLIDS
ncbi:transporter substrate-binding domain-containing protein [Psychrobium sp. 1_MG-2023]|uniref:transporter substrate-binding domain-containing protein n=1 Tax=Psychrobium sp. 1_MG-2023 TaxID=3062624 RepID=UPI000C32F095|nr:transporter substrate-binding domain-containing protein [Psychrobium sp. 1_MG-2023]MDP2559668.1 transporter substrate-binding domain-containing protein [Psychrobium sp. 1_MG-2023]PKF59499.1 hypothetical protein CW748_01635 [Alteromonadales bacterium alter-6D02]